MRNGGLLGKSRVDYGVKKYGQHLSGNHKKDIDSSISNKKEGGKSYLLHQQCINEKKKKKPSKPGVHYDLNVFSQSNNTTYT